jgi:3-dehydroquinate dehydratase-2
VSDILILNGPNLNLLGTREPDKYGSLTLVEICQRLDEKASVDLSCFQSNAEAELIDAVQQTPAKIIILNPAALTHTSVGLRDALLAVNMPFIEVHLSNIYAREAFRQHSYFSDIALGVISGLGAQGYELALQVAEKFLKEK